MAEDEGPSAVPRGTEIVPSSQFPVELRHWQLGTGNWELKLMITLHRLGHSDEPFLLNDDLIVTVEACPDTHVALATGTKIVVTETPEQVAEAVLEWRPPVRLAALRAD